MKKTNQNKDKTVSKNHPNSEKVNLSSVNKIPKSKVASKNYRQLNTKLTTLNPFKKKDAFKRDDVGKFTTGNGGISIAKRLNWKRAVPLILIISVAGGYFVFTSFAATPNLVPKTTTKTITETVVDRSRSYKTVTGTDLNSPGANRLYGISPYQQKPHKDAFDPNGKLIPGGVKMRFGWVGPDNITVCTTMHGQTDESVQIQIKNFTTVSSRGPGITNKTAVIGQQPGAQTVNPTQFGSAPLSANIKATSMKKAEICTDLITRNNYGSDLEIVISSRSARFEKIEIYGVEMIESAASEQPSTKEPESNNTKTSESTQTPTNAVPRKNQPRNSLQNFWLRLSR